MTDHRPPYYVTDAEAAAIRAWVVAPTRSDAGPRIWAPPDGNAIREIEPTGRADCRVCGRRIHVDEAAIVFGLVTEPDRGTRLSAAYLHTRCPEEDRCP